MRRTIYLCLAVSVALGAFLALCFIDSGTAGLYNPHIQTHSGEMMEIGLRKKKDVNAPAKTKEEIASSNANIDSNVADLLFKKKKAPEKDVIGGGSYSNSVDKYVEKKAPAIDAEIKVRRMMGIPEDNTRMIEEDDIKSFLKKNGVRPKEVDTSDFEAVLHALRVVKGDSNADPRS